MCWGVSWGGTYFKKSINLISIAMKNDSTLVFKLIEQNAALQKSIDSLMLKEKFYRLNYKLENNTKIVNEVSSFYEMAWQDLIWLLGFIFTFFGIIVPVIVNYIQNKSFNDLSLSVKNDLDKEFSEKQNEFELKNEESMRLTLESFQKRFIELQIAHENVIIEQEANALYLQSRIMHIENNTSVKKNFIYVSDFVRSADLFLQIGKDDRAMVLIKAFSKACKTVTSRDEWLNIEKRLIDKKNIRYSLGEFVEKLEKHDNLKIKALAKQIKENIPILI